MVGSGLKRTITLAPPGDCVRIMSNIERIEDYIHTDGPTAVCCGMQGSSPWRVD